MLKEVEKGESSTFISEKYGVPKQTLSGWLKEKTKKFIQKSRKTKLLRKESVCDSHHVKI